MRVLLLSRNRVVQELVKLGSGGIEGVELEIAAEPSGIRGDHFDLLLLDERYVQEKGAEAWEHLIVARTVLLGDRDETTAGRFDDILAKPFLPADIRRILEQSTSLPEEKRVSDTLGSFLKDEELETTERRKDAEILDSEELRKIRQLLNEEEPLPELSEVTTPMETTMGIDDFVALLEGNRVKKIRKLLKGAKIQLIIEFPEEG